MKQKLIFFLYLIILIIPQITLCFNEKMVTPGYFMLVMLPLGLYWVYMSHFRRPSKAYLWAFPVLFLGAFQIVIGYLFGKGIIGVDMWLNLATTSPGEAGEMLSQIYPSVVAVVIIYLPTLTYAIIDLRNSNRRKRKLEDGSEERYTGALPKSFLRVQRIIGWVVLTAAMIPTYLSLTNEKYHFHDDFFPYNVCYNLHMAIARQHASLNYLETSKDFRFHAVSEDSDTVPEIVMLVIGETSRATNWQLMGYERETNPQLTAIREGRVDSVRMGERLLVFPDCMSQSNTTHKSVPILLTRACAEDYSTLYTSKGLLAAAREAGFETAFLSNEPRNHSFTDHLAEQAEDVLFMRDSLTENYMDTLLLPRLREMLERHPRRLFMVVHTYGSHSTYSDRYTKEQSVWQPDQVIKATKDNRHILINAYDNTIHLTDHMLGSFAAMLAETGRPSVMLYISDHGEDIYDDDRNLYLHASPHPTYYQLHVPLLCWSNEQYRTLYTQRWNLMEQRQAEPLQSDCVYPTMLSLAGIATPYGQSTLSLCSPEYRTKKQRTYLNDHNESCLYEDCLDEQDFRVLKARNMRTY